MHAGVPPDDDDRTRSPERAPAARLGSTGNALPVGTRLAEFELTGLVGEGGFGIVYLAHDHYLDRQVALKEYMPASLAVRSGPLTVAVRRARDAETFEAGLKSFVNEAQLLARFDHPALVKVYRFWQGNGTAYMVMPFYEGVTLKETLGRAGPPDEAWLKNLLRPLLDALETLHREHCFHRDIAPDNILILPSGQPLLLDFGAARRVIGDMAQSLTVIFKPGYAPIEQYAEQPGATQGPWTDVYALAAVMYFAITGRVPVPSLSRLLSETLKPLAEVAAGRYGDAFLRGIDRALAVQPEQRPQDISQLRALLDLGERREQGHAAAPAVAATAKSGDREPTAKPVTRWGSGAVYAAIAVALAAGLALMFSGGDKPRPHEAPAQPAVAPPPPSTVAPPRAGADAPAATRLPAADPVPPAVATPRANGEIAPTPATVPPATTDVAPAPAEPPRNRATAPAAAPPPSGDAVPAPVAPPRSDAGEAPAVPALPEAADAATPQAPATQTPDSSRVLGKTSPAARKPSPTVDKRAELCSTLLQRASLGEALSPDEAAQMRRACK